MEERKETKEKLKFKFLLGSLMTVFQRNLINRCMMYFLVIKLDLMIHIRRFIGKIQLWFDGEITVVSLIYKVIFEHSEIECRNFI